MNMESVTPGQKRKILAVFITAFILVSACQSRSGVVVETTRLEQGLENPPGVSEAEVTTLSSLRQIDQFPLYTMVYSGELSLTAAISSLQQYQQEPAWTCFLIIACGVADEVLLGRDIDIWTSCALIIYDRISLIRYLSSIESGQPALWRIVGGLWRRSLNFNLDCR